ncbi:MAG: hypothetical protein GWN32_02365 [Gemmatimonadetes bacterium]|nr:hypothetical protein [Gemmatimonadota bacterium]
MPGEPAFSRFGAPDAVVRPGQSIQSAIDAAEAGDRIFVRPGVYREALRIEKPDIALVGLGRRIGSSGAAVVVIEDPGDEENGIYVDGNGDGVELVNLTIRGFEENGALLYGVDGFLLSELIAEDDGEYGLFPVHSQNGVIERSVASGHSDTGIYVGQSTDVVIRDSRAFGNVNGFEIENSSRIQAFGNEAFGNTAGFLVVLLPGLPVKASSDILLENNYSHDNDLPNFADHGFEALVPSGSGILVIGTDDTRIRNNRVTGNDFVGIALINTGILSLLDPSIVIDVEPFPAHARIVNNVVTGNGTGAPPIPALPVVADLLWDGTGDDNCWSGNTFDSSLNLNLPTGPPEPALPACD